MFVNPFEFQSVGRDCLVAVFPNGGSVAKNIGRALCSRFTGALQVYEQARAICAVPMETLWQSDYDDAQASDPLMDIAATFINCAAVNAIRRQMGGRLRLPDLVIVSSLGIFGALEAACPS